MPRSTGRRRQGVLGRSSGIDLGACGIGESAMLGSGDSGERRAKS